MQLAKTFLASGVYQIFGGAGLHGFDDMLGLFDVGCGKNRSLREDMPQP